MRKKLLSLVVLIVLSISFLPVYAYEEVSEENMELASAAYRKGIDLVRVKAYDSAIASFEKALQYYPQMSDAYYNIASIYLAQKKYDEAYNTYVKVIALNPNDYDSILQAAKLSYNKKNYSLAMKYAKYIPDDYEYYGMAQELYNNARELLYGQRNKVERSKVTTADKNKSVIIDKFDSPAGMAVDSEGNMFVACYSDNSIIKVARNKARSVFAKDFLLDGPIGLAIDAYDNVYVANYDGNNILKITKAGSVSVFMNNISHPYFLYIKNDVLYVSEQGNDVVLTYNLSSGK